MGTISSAVLGACALIFFLLGDFLMLKVVVGVILFVAFIEIVTNFIMRRK